MSGPAIQLSGERQQSATLHHGDCLAMMRAMAAEGVTVSHIITDPPYEQEMHASKSAASKRHRDDRPMRHDGGAYLRELDFQPINAIRQEVCELAAQVCTGWLLAFCTAEGVAAWRDAIEAAGIRYKRACVWVKPDSAPQFNGQGPAMGAESIVAAWCGSGFSSWNGGGKRGVWTHLTNPPGSHGLHPTEKPLRLMRELLLDFTQPGDTVLDPFMGTGATGVACVREGRHFIGAELSEDYHAAAVLRIRDALGTPQAVGCQPSLFDGGTNGERGKAIQR